MNSLSMMETKQIKTIISQAKGLELTIKEIFNGDGMEANRYTAYKDMAMYYNDLVFEAKKVMKMGMFYTFELDKIPFWADTLWPQQKAIFETVLVSTRLLITTLESNVDFIGEEIDNIENFLKNKLRSVIFSTPEKEIEVQNRVETLLVGKGLNKGIDYDRETGKFNYSGREYIPDFIVPKLNMCIEIKLLKDKLHKSKLIEEINADITAYKKNYENILFVIYDLGIIRDEIEFCRDILNNEGIKVIVVKH